jgi:hypothetical protein
MRQVGKAVQMPFQAVNRGLPFEAFALVRAI